MGWGLIAVGEGLEPSRGDSINDIFACKRVVNPLSFIYFFIPAH